LSKQRPVNLDLFSIKQPLPAIVSIVHRVTGLILFVGIAILIYMLDQSLRSEESFASLQETLSGGFVKLIVWGVLSALIYHFVAGIKHLLMDFGIGETLESAQLGAKITIAISVVLILYTGICIW
jgi:succinate dehydrogenase / fumarate reductase cytochrome b subunit